MKKLMCALAAVAAGVAMADVSSANIVGYNTINTGANKRYATLTPCFLPVSGATTYKMKDLTASGFAFNGGNPDTLQALDSASTSTKAEYLYCDKAMADALCEEYKMPAGSFDAYIGWWDQKKGGLGVAAADEDAIANGTGFLGDIRSGSDVAVQSSGEAPTKSTSYTTDGKRYPLFGCYIPKALKLKQLTASGFDYNGGNPDTLQVLDPVTTSTKAEYLYCDKVMADALCEEYKMPAGSFDAYIGWWDQKKGGLGVAPADEDDVVIGETFLGDIRSLSEVTVNFPSSLD